MLRAMFPAPPIPSFPNGHASTTSYQPRYEDVTQDGRLQPIATTAGLAGLWSGVLMEHRGHLNTIKAGIIPILTRLTIHTVDQSVRIDRPFEAFTGFALAHDKQGDEVTRLFMQTWCEIRATTGKLGRKEALGEQALVGTVFSEYTYTRPLAPPDQRKVTRLDVDEMPAVPETRYAAPAPATAQEAPAGATYLDELAPDSAEYAFTLDQTDLNQHVNSLVYIRLCLEAFNRRLAAAGRLGKLRAKAVDVAYRKPCFAGDKVRASLRLFEHSEGLGAAGLVSGDDGKPRCYLRVLAGA